MTSLFLALLHPLTHLAKLGLLLSGSLLPPTLKEHLESMRQQMMYPRMVLIALVSAFQCRNSSRETTGSKTGLCPWVLRQAR